MQIRPIYRSQVHICHVCNQYFAFRWIVFNNDLIIECQYRHFPGLCTMMKLFPSAVYWKCLLLGTWYDGAHVVCSRWLDDTLIQLPVLWNYLFSIQVKNLLFIYCVQLYTLHTISLKHVFKENLFFDVVVSRL